MSAVRGIREVPRSGGTELLDHEIRFGVLRVRLHHEGAGPPPVTVTYRTVPLEIELRHEAEGIWHLSATIPPAAVSEGVQTLLISLPDGTAIGAAQMVLGRPAEPSVEARLDLMRQELDLLKRALRRQAREG